MLARRILLAAGLATVASARAQERDETHRAAVRRAAEAVILPDHTRFAETAARFAAATQALADAPDAARAEAARAAWRDAAIAFQRVRHFRFGPLDAFDRGFRLALFPDPRNVVGRELAAMLREADLAAIAPDAFATGRVGGQGLPAAERLLFGEAAPRLLVPEEAFRRRLLATIGRNVASLASDLARDWSAGERAYARALEGAPGTPYRTPTEGLRTLFTSLHGGLEFVAERQVARPLGASIRGAVPRRAEAWRSSTSLALVRESLDALAALYRAAFAPLLHAADPALADEAERNWAAVARAAAAIAPDLETAVADPRGRAAIEDLLRAIGDLRRLLGERVGPVIGLPVGFNAMDGD